jgi:hypothetical protein
VHRLSQPFPKFGDPMRLSDRGLQAWRASLLPDETDAEAGTVLASVAFVAVLIDGLEAPQVGSGSVSG